MDWVLISEFIVHYVEQYRKENNQQEEQSKQVSLKLVQLQLGELTDKKKNKNKIQTPVIAAATVPPVEEPTYNQTMPLQAAAPQITAPNYGGQPQTYSPQLANPATQMLPINVYLNHPGAANPAPQGGYYRQQQQPQGRGEEAREERGGQGPMR